MPMCEVLEVEDSNAGTITVPGLELLEELWEEISTELSVQGIKICLATEVLSEPFCIEID